MEIIQSLGQIFIFFLSLITYFVKDTGSNVAELQSYSSYAFVPVLSMMMDFLWLAYRRYEYKYTMIRWAWYIVIRTLIVFLLQYSTNLFFISGEYQTIYYNDTVNIFYGLLPIIDFIQYVYYARKFYLHLKSREKEIRLFYFDKEAYLDSKYLRIHFKVATILVGIAFFFFNLSTSANLFSISLI